MVLNSQSMVSLSPWCVTDMTVIAQRGGNNRCLSHSLGCSMAIHSNLWLMELTSSNRTYKSSRVLSSVFCSQTLLALGPVEMGVPQARCTQGSWPARDAKLSSRLIIQTTSWLMGVVLEPTGCRIALGWLCQVIGGHVCQQGVHILLCAVLHTAEDDAPSLDVLAYDCLNCLLPSLQFAFF